MVYPLTDGRWSTYTAVQGSQSHSQPADYNSDGVTIILPMSCHVLSLREEEECLAAWTSSLHWRPSPALFVALIIFNPVQSSMSWIRFPLGLPLPLLPDVAPTILSLFTESPLDLSVSIKTIIGPRSSPHTQEEWLLSIHILQKSSCLPFLLPRNSQMCDVPSLKMRGFYSARSSSKSNFRTHMLLSAWVLILPSHLGNKGDITEQHHWPLKVLQAVSNFVVFNVSTKGRSLLTISSTAVFSIIFNASVHLPLF